MTDNFDQQADDIISSVDQGTAAQIRNNAMIATGVNHDQEAEYQHLAKFTGQPVDTVRALPDAAKQQAAAQTVPADQMAKTRPVTAQFFTDPNNARKAMDDAPTLSDLEGHVSNVGYTEGVLNDASLNLARQFEGGRARIGRMIGDQNMVDDALDMTRSADDADQMYVPTPDSAVGRAVYGGVKGLANAIPALGAAFVGGPLAAAGIFGLQSKTQSYGKYKARGATDNQADLGSDLEGGIAAAAMFLPTSYLTSKLTTTGMGEFLSNFLVRDFGAQFGQAVATNAVDTAVANPKKTWMDFVKELPSELGQSFVSAATFAGVMAPVHSIANRMQGNDAKVANAKASADYAANLNNLSAASTLRARDPEAFNKFMTEASDNGPVQDLYFNPKDLAQSGVDINKIAALVPSVEQQLPNAIATGQDVKISVPEFATHIAGQDFAQNMIDHLKTDPDGFSKAQADQYMQTEGESLKSEVQKVLAEKQGDNAFKTSQQVVEDDLFKQLQATGRFTDDVTKPQAKLLSNFYAVQAARLGVTPEEFYNQHKVAIQAESPVTPGDLSEGSFGQDVKGGFTSGVEQAAQNLKQEKGTGEQMLAALKNSAGVKGEELDWTGTNEFLDGKKSVTKQELLDHIAANKIDVHEVTHGSNNTLHPEIKENKDGSFTVYDAQGYEVGRWEDHADAEDAYHDLDSEIDDQTKFKDYTLPGGENYREVLMTLPDTHRNALYAEQNKITSKGHAEGRDLTPEETAQIKDIHARMAKLKRSSDLYKSSHFDEANILAHLRLSDRTDADGKKVLMVEEIQSDWHQAGRKKGYKTAATAEEYQKQLADWNDKGAKLSADAHAAYEEYIKAKEAAPQQDLAEVNSIDDLAPMTDAEKTSYDAWQNARDAVRENQGQRPFDPNKNAVPNAPLKKTWQETAFRRALQIAAEEGYDKIAWTTGEQQNERFDLSKKIGAIEAFQYGGRTTLRIRDLNDSAIGSKSFESPTDPKIEDYVGKDMAKKIADANGEGDFRGLDLQVGGEGMKGFYDKILPDYARKFGKKFGAGVGESTLPRTDDTDYRISTYPDGEAVVEHDGNMKEFPNVEEAEAYRKSLLDGPTVHSMDITPEMRESLKQGIALFQGEETRRGSFNPETNAITLFKAADLSTFFHESGHFFLETLNKIALDTNAPQEIKNDMQATLKWLGVKDLADWNSRDIEAKRDAHEQFARGFETFLFEGKSPNVEMQGIFSRFRAWLLNIYQSTENLRAELTPEMRGVFDRMLASTQQIKEAEAARAYEPFFKNQKEAGMNDQEWKAYQDLGINATLEAVNNLETRSLRDMRWSSNAKDRIIRGLQKSAKSKRNTVRREVTDAVMNEPVNRASTFLRFGMIDGEKLEGNHRLDVDALREMYGNEADAPWRQLENKYGKYGVMGKDGVHPDALAEQFGFTSGDELVKALIANENPRERIPAEIDRVMLEKYGDLTDPASLRRAADEAIHNEARTRFVVTEMNALQKAIGNKPILAKAAKSYAEDLIAKSKIRELIPSRYSSAETRSARAAEAARKEGDIKTAAIEKRNQLINSYATKATFDAQEEVEGIVKYMRKFDNPKLAKAITPGNFEQINALLERFDFKTKSLKAIDRAKSLTAWVEAQREDGIEPNIHPDILDEANRKNYKDMTVEELRGMNDAIKQIEHLGRLKNKLLTAQDNRTFAEATTTIANSIHEEAKGKVADNRTRAGLGDVKRTINDYLVSLRKSASLVRELDGFKDGGPMWEYFTRSANHAGDTEASMKAKAVVDINKIAREMLTREKMGGKGQYFDSVGMALNREERLGIALNMGNAGNIQRLLDGEGWKISQIEPIVKTLTKEDWKTIQDIWDYFESYRPQIGAKEKRVYGVEPEWVEPQPLSVQTRDGHTVELKGGYYPIKYDPRRSPQAEAHDAAELAKSQMAGAYTSATTRRSFTKSRVEEVTGRPLLYSMDGLFNGLNEVIHDLAWHEWGIDANRLLRNKSIDNAIRNRHGADVMLELKNHTRDMLSGDKQAADALGRIMSHFRKGSSISGLGFNIMNSVVNMVGITQSMVRVGPGWVGRGLAHWANNPMDAIMDMRDQSTEMRLRFQTMNRELNEIKQQVRGKSTARQKFDTAMFTPMMMTQLVVDTPTWWGAKMKALSEGNDEARSIALADQAVLDAQGGGQIKDLASIQRGSEFKKLLTTFYGFFSTTYNLGVEATKKTNFKDPADVLRLGGDYLLLYTIPALMGTVIQSLIRNGFDEFDDMEKFGKKIAKDQVSFGMSTMPYVREFAGVGQVVTGNKPQDYNGPAGLRFIQQVDKLSTEVAQGKLDKGLFNAGVDVAGTAVHLPSTQIRRTVDGIAAIADGKTINPLAIISGGPTKH